MPWIICCALCARIAFTHSPELAIGLAVLFDGYLRPYELLHARYQDLLAPTLGFDHFTLIVCPITGGRPSKTKIYDDGIPFDSSLRPQIHDLLVWLRSSKTWQPHEKLFKFDHTTLNSAIKDAASWLGIAPLELTAYHGRHGGPSEDHAFGGRSTTCIQKRGRWAALSSLKRYEQHNRLHVVLAALPNSLKTFSLSCCVHLVDLVTKPRELIRPDAQTFALPTAIPLPKAD